MSHALPAGRRPVMAPPIVRDVLRQPGRPLDARVVGRFGGSDSLQQRAPVRVGVGPLQVSAPESSSEAEAERLAEPIAEGRGLPAHLSFDFSKIRIHTDERAAKSARAVGARAYTVGSDIVFAEGQYQPFDAPGRHLLAHELVHAARAAADSSSLLHRYEAREHQDCG